MEIPQFRGDKVEKKIMKCLSVTNEVISLNQKLLKEVNKLQKEKDSSEEFEQGE